jgi:hypothetical protein
MRINIIYVGRTDKEAIMKAKTKLYIFGATAFAGSLFLFLYLASSPLPNDKSLRTKLVPQVNDVRTTIGKLAEIRQQLPNKDQLAAARQDVQMVKNELARTNGNLQTNWNTTKASPHFSSAVMFQMDSGIKGATDDLNNAATRLASVERRLENLTTSVLSLHDRISLTEQRAFREIDEINTSLGQPSINSSVEVVLKTAGTMLGLFTGVFSLVLAWRRDKRETEEHGQKVRKSKRR